MSAGLNRDSDLRKERSSNFTQKRTTPTKGSRKCSGASGGFRGGGGAQSTSLILAREKGEQSNVGQGIATSPPKKKNGCAPDKEPGAHSRVTCQSLRIRIEKGGQGLIY